MAIYSEKSSDNLIYSNELTNGKFTESWNDKSGKLVEDYITIRLKEAHDSQITGGSYSNEVLTLNKANGDSINIDVTVAPATYDFDMIFFLPLHLPCDFYPHP